MATGRVPNPVMLTDAILIIGAGAAGLAAARDLSLAGRKVIVLEARERIGGRIFTCRDPSSPTPIELGAEFVHGKSPALWRIAEKLPTKPYEVTDRHWYFEDGKLSKSGDFWKKLERLMDEMKKSESDRSFKEFLASLPDDEETRRAKAMGVRYVEGFHAANIDRIGIQGLIKANEAAEGIDGDKMYRFLNGYDSIMEILRAEAEAHGTVVHLKTVVKEIHWDGDGIEAVCESEHGPGAFAASAAIVTLPLGVLHAEPNHTGAVRFVPELPETKRAAINKLAMGDVVRIVIRFREHFWERLKLSDQEDETADSAEVGFIHYPEAPFPTWWTQLPVRAPVLVGWVGGPGAALIRRSSSPTPGSSAERLGWGGAVRERSAAVGSNQRVIDSEHDVRQSSDPFILDQAITSLSRIFSIPSNFVRDQLEASYLHDWHDDPFSRGAYSYVPVNGLDAQRVLSQAIDKTLFFAGEAMADGHIGTVHGAIQSGQCAAKQVLAG